MNGMNAALKALEDAGFSGVEFEMPWLLLLALFLPLVAMLLLWPRRARFIFSRGEAAAHLGGGKATLLRRVAQGFYFLAMAGLVLAIAGPNVLGEPDPEHEEGIDIVAVLDVSGSMRAADFKPRDRLHVAKQVIRDYLFSRKSDRIALVVFAGEAYTQAPLTKDRALLTEILRGVRTGVITDGTAIGDAVALGVNRLRDSKAKGRALILVTDGENNAGNLSPVRAAELAKEFGIRVFPILVGKGGKVPFPTSNIFGQQSYSYREVSVNPKLLKELAQKSEGAFFSAQDPNALKNSFQQILETLEKSQLESGTVVRKRVPLYPLLVPILLLFFLISLTISLTKGAVVP